MKCPKCSLEVGDSDGDAIYCKRCDTWWWIRELVAMSKKNKCSICNGEPAKYQVNPYAVELYEDRTKDWYCEICIEALIDDI